jgi:endoglucanase
MIELSRRARHIEKPSRSARRLLLLVLSAGLIVGCGSSSMTSPAPTPTPAPTPGNTGDVTVSGAHFMRDGVAWIPHGVVSAAFNAAPAVRAGGFLTAYNDLNSTELAAMKTWGADVVRFQVAQPALDPQNNLYDPTFIAAVQNGVTEARAAGLNVIVSVQDESGTGEPNPTPLPDAATGRVWQQLAPLFKGDTGILFEIMNEPQPAPTAANWAAWASAMNSMITIIRVSGATNVLIADGLGFAEYLEGAPTLADPLNQVAYADHPYFHSAADQTSTAWDTKFGTFAATAPAPVLITEWSTENEPPPDPHFYCDRNTATSALAFLQYLQSKSIGLVGYAYDAPNAPNAPRDGRITQDFNGTPTTYSNNAQCTDAPFGPGTIIQNWYHTGSVPAMLE